MKKISTVNPGILILLAAIMLLATPVFGQSPVWRVNDQGTITVDGAPFQVKGGSWFGLEGRHEPSNDTANPSGAPMEMYMGNVWWAPTSRTYQQDINEMKQLGFNLIRIPIAPQTLDPNDPQGKDPFLKNNPSVRYQSARQNLEELIKMLDAAGMYVLLDMHSCSNYVGWRAGRFDARPPYVDKDRQDYDFKRENCSCAATNNPSTVTKIQAYNETKWLSDMKTLAGLGDALGVSNIMGIDIFNEPWDYTWAEWSSLIDKAYAAINSVNPNILIFAQGISASAGNQDGTPNTITQVPHGLDELNPNWGENLYEAGANPPAMPKNRLVYSPHTYGPSVYVQKMFMDPSQPQCTGLEGDAAGDKDCNIVIDSAILRQGWQEHFGYLKALGYAVVIGEWGGNPDWPRGTSNLRDQQRWNHITDNTVDMQWQNAFADYLVSVGITDTIYWSINPESGDTGGIYTHAYDPVSNTGGWGTWNAPDQRKLDLLAKLWGPVGTLDPNKTPGPIATPTVGPVSCNGVPTWSAGTTYDPAGQRVVYNGKLYKNNWYSLNQNPEQNSGPYMVWTLLGSCSSIVATPTPTIPPVTPKPTTPPPSTPRPVGAGDMWFVPGNANVAPGATVKVELHLNSGTQKLAAYGITITFNAGVATAAATDVVAGANGFVTATNDKTPGTLVISGFDTTGKGPGADLHVLSITFKAGSSEGSTVLGLSIDTLSDASYATIGTPNAINGAITVKKGGKPGDVNDDGLVNIVDALMVAQHSVGISVPINLANADVNCDGMVNIVDALMIAQASVGSNVTLGC